MREEVESMAERVAAAEPFAAPAAVASHRDLWLDNLLVTPDGALFVLDWDGLALGDPMMDLAMLLGPSRSNVRSALEKDLPSLPFSAAERERFRAYARASLLDWIIDPLSDWVEAAHEPEHGAAIRAANRRVHEEALAVYRKIYA
jgi:aminoglycoside phosphotransferase (APT) family kinase protein